MGHMKAFLGKLSDAKYSLMASATVALMSDVAVADTIGGTSDNLIKQASSVGKLMVAGSFIGGLVMLATGLMKLKQAADTQGNQVKYSEGMWRCGVGAGLVAIPAFSGMLNETFFGGSSTPSITDGGGATF
jgi:hypothetical protein